MHAITKLVVADRTKTEKKKKRKKKEKKRPLGEMIIAALRRGICHDRGCLCWINNAITSSLGRTWVSPGGKHRANVL